MRDSLKEASIPTVAFDLPDSLNFASLVAQMVKQLPAVRKTWVQSLGREDPLEKAMAIHSWAEEPGGLQSMGSQRVRPD